MLLQRIYRSTRRYFPLDLPAHVIGLLLFCFNDPHRVDLIKRDDAVFHEKQRYRVFHRVPWRSQV